MEMRARMPKSEITLFFLLLSYGATDSSVAGDAEKPCGLHCKAEEKKADEIINSLNQVNGGNVHCANDLSVSTDPDAAMGARLAMAQIYGSCDVLKLPVLENCNVKRISSKLKFTPVSEGNKYPRRGVTQAQLPLLRDSHPYLQGFKNSECFTLGKCEQMKASKELSNDVCKKASCDPILEPPTYQYGGKGNGKTSVYQHRGGKGLQYNGLDCSAFVSAALGMRGLRFYPGTDNNGMGFGTAGYSSLGKKDANGKPIDCFDEPIAFNGIQAGDLLVAPNNHIVMIDTVGVDPYGINGILSQARSAKTDSAQADAFNRLGVDTCKKRNPGKSGEKICITKPITELLNPESVIDQSLRLKQLNRLAEDICLISIDKDDFQMTIMHSTSDSNQTGVQRQHVKNGTFPPLSTLLEMKGRRDCIEELMVRPRF